MEGTFEVTLSRDERYEFDVDFQDGSGTTLRMDEPEPLGRGAGPNAARVAAAAIGNCLSASLLFCLDKAHIEVADVTTTITGTVVRNERGRLRLGSLKVRIEPEFGAEGDSLALEPLLQLNEGVGWSINHPANLAVTNDPVLA